MKAQKTLLENFSRYEFAADGTVTNKSTGKIITIEDNGSMRLTDDSGARKRLFKTDIIKEVANPGSTTVIAETAVKKTQGSAAVDLTDDDDTGSKLFIPGEKKAAAPKEPKAEKKESAPKAEGTSRKLSVVDVAEIKRRIADGDKNKDIAEAYSVHSSTISDIKGLRLYKTVAAAV